MDLPARTRMRLPAGSVVFAAYVAANPQNTPSHLTPAQAQHEHLLAILISASTTHIMVKNRTKKIWKTLDITADTDPTSDFPTLSGQPRQAVAPSSAVAGWNSEVIRQGSVQQQPQPSQQPTQQSQRLQQQQQPQQRAPSAAPSQQSIDGQLDGQRSSDNNRGTGGAEDFPPLGGQQVNGDVGELGQSNGFGSSVASPDSSQPTVRGAATNGQQQTELSIRNASNAAFLPPQGSQAPPAQQQAPIGSGQPAPPVQTHQSASTQQSIMPHQQQQQPVVPANGQPQQQAATGKPASSASTTLPPGVKRYADMTDTEKYGLTALSAAFEARRTLESGGQPDQTLPPAMRNAVFLGQDLNSLGLDLDSPDPLYTTFTPFPSAAAANGGSSGAFDFHDR